eukprot:6214008-Pleurochrysis_carterae.AAC.1
MKAGKQKPYSQSRPGLRGAKASRNDLRHSCHANDACTLFEAADIFLAGKHLRNRRNTRRPNFERKIRRPHLAGGCIL